MTTARLVGTLCLIAAIAAGIAILRTEQARCARRVQRLRSQCVELQRQRWAQQVELARLRAPTSLRERIERMNLPVRPPQVRTQLEIRIANARGQASSIGHREGP